MLTFPSVPNHVRHPPKTTGLASMIPESQPSSSEAGTQLYWLFSSPQKPPRTLPVHDVIHIPRSHFQSGVSILTSLNGTSAPRAREHLRSCLHQTNPCAKEKVLSLTKPKVKIYKTKSLCHYITFAKERSLKSYWWSKRGLKDIGKEGSRNRYWRRRGDLKYIGEGRETEKILAKEGRVKIYWWRKGDLRDIGKGRETWMILEKEGGLKIYWQRKGDLKDIREGKETEKILAMEGRLKRYWWWKGDLKGIGEGRETEEMLAKEGWIKRYRDRGKQYNQNWIFQNNERKVLHHLGGEWSKTYQQPDAKKKKNIKVLL